MSGSSGPQGRTRFIQEDGRTQRMVGIELDYAALSLSFPVKRVMNMWIRSIICGLVFVQGLGRVNVGIYLGVGPFCRLGTFTF